MKGQSIQYSLMALAQTYLYSSSLVVTAFSLVNDSPKNNSYGIHLTSKDRSNSKNLRVSKLNAELEHRRSFLHTAVVGTCSSLILITPTPSNALVKGNAPPPPKKVGGGGAGKQKCGINLEECQEKAELMASEQEEKMRAEAAPVDVTKLGTRYVDVNEDGVGKVRESSSEQGAKVGDVITVYYKVLKLGKRSYDGLSGEGTVVFSRGYGLEDDEDKRSQKSFQFQLGDSSVIGALNDAVPGMIVGTSRRISILPQMGWRKPDVVCDGGPGGSGSGGDLKTDYAIVPTATMVATEVCFDKGKRPFPTSYAEQRRMAQRFDQSLIMEVKLVSIDKS